MPRLLALLLIALLSLPTPAVAQSETIRFEPTPQLTIFRSKHYRIFTNLSQRETVPYGRHMDALYEQYGKRFRGLSGNQVEPMPLYLFRSEQQYDRFLAEHDIDATHSGGMFFVTHKLEGLATWVQPGNRRKTLEVLQHEGFHQFAWHAFGPKLPVWLNEGLAQYFESAVLSDDGRMSLGMSNASRIEKVRRAVASGRVLRAEALMSITADQWSSALRHDHDHASLLYAQSWSLAYFLIHGQDGRYRPKLMDYLERLGRGEASDQAMLMSFGRDGLSNIGRQWRAFALNHEPDDVTQACERMVFLGTGLRVLAEQEKPMPQDLDALRTTLQQHGFKLRRSEMGVTRNYSAQREELFSYSIGSGSERDFVLLDPDRAGLPPRITAPGLEPQPTLTWSRDRQGKLVQGIEYK